MVRPTPPSLSLTRSILITCPFQATKKLAKLSWRLAADWCVTASYRACTNTDATRCGDSHRTLLPIQYPPHAIALGSIYVAALLSSFEQPTQPARPGFRGDNDIAAMLSKHGEWEKKYQVQVEDLEGTLHSHTLKHTDFNNHGASYRHRTHSSGPPHSSLSKSVREHVPQHSLFPLPAPLLSTPASTTSTAEFVLVASCAI